MRSALQISILVAVGLVVQWFAPNLAASTQAGIAVRIEAIRAIPRYANLEALPPADRDVIRQCDEMSDEQLNSFLQSSNGRERSIAIHVLSRRADLPGLFKLSEWLDDQSRALPLAEVSPVPHMYPQREVTVSELLQVTLEDWLEDTLDRDDKGPKAAFDEHYAKIDDPWTIAMVWCTLLRRDRHQQLAIDASSKERFKSVPPELRWIVLSELRPDLYTVFTPSEYRDELASLGPDLIARLKSDQSLATTDPTLQSEQGQRRLAMHRDAIRQILAQHGM